MNEVEINGVRYRIGKLPAMDQFHVSRRILPVAQGLGRGFASLAAKLPNTNGQDTGNGEAQADSVPEPDMQPAAIDDTLFEAFGPVADALSKMSDADSEYIIKKCLIRCLRFNESQNNWAAIMAPNGHPMFDDMDMMVMVRLTYEVIVENIYPSLRDLFRQNSAGVSTSRLT